jgi:hypothetical protein
MSSWPQVLVPPLNAAILLLQAAERWKAENGGKPPSNGKERSAFKELLRSMKRSSHEVPMEVGMMCT